MIVMSVQDFLQSKNWRRDKYGDHFEQYQQHAGGSFASNRIDGCHLDSLSSLLSGFASNLLLQSITAFIRHNYNHDLSVLAFAKSRGAENG